MVLPGVHIERISGLALAFGLDWHVVLADDLRREALRLATLHRASHFVVCGELMATVGLAHLRGEGCGNAPLYSAAHLLAQRFPEGSRALVFALSTGQYWLVGVHEGAVMARTDRLFTSPEQTRQAVQGLRQAYPALALLDAGQCPSLHELVQADPGPARLVRLAPWRRWQPGSAQVAGLGVACLAGGLLLGVFASSETRGADPAKAQTAQTAWHEQLQQTLAAHWIHGPEGTRGLVDSLHALPVTLAGWQLTRAECHARRGHWDCVADYARTALGASNAGLLGRAPAGWQVSFVPLEQAQVRWRLDAAGDEATQAELADGRASERELFSHLQAIRPALGLVRFAPPRALAVPAPLDKTGAPLPMPADLPRFHTRAASLRAPLRSLSLLLPHCRGFGWRSVVLSLSEAAGTGLRDSRFILTLEGSLYERSFSSSSGGNDARTQES
ncbi:MAG: type 4b pilus protein PilO2 [Castellaniella sp.]